MNHDLYKLISLIELKGNFYLEPRKDSNSKRPIFTFMLVREEVRDSLKRLFDKFDIEYNIINKKVKYKTQDTIIEVIRISNRPRLKKLFNLIDEHIEHKPKHYDEVFKYVMK